MITTTTKATTFANAIKAIGTLIVASVGGCFDAWLGWRDSMRGSVRQRPARVPVGLSLFVLLGSALRTPVMARCEAHGGSNPSRYSAVA